MNRAEIGELMDLVYAQWPQERNAQNIKNLAKLWQAALADMPFELAQRAVIKTMCNPHHGHFFPKVNQIREAALDMVDGQPIPWGETWQMARDQGYNPKALPPLVAEAMNAIGDSWSWKNETNTTARRAQFRDTYQAMVNQDREQKLLPGALRAELQAANERARLSDGERMGVGGRRRLSGPAVGELAGGVGAGRAGLGSRGAT